MSGLGSLSSKIFIDISRKCIVQHAEIINVKQTKPLLVLHVFYYVWHCGAYRGYTASDVCKADETAFSVARILLRAYCFLKQLHFPNY